MDRIINLRVPENYLKVNIVGLEGTTIDQFLNVLEEYFKA